MCAMIVVPGASFRRGSPIGLRVCEGRQKGMRFRPRKGFILVRRIDPPKRSGGILIDDGSPQIIRGVVVAVNNKGKR